MDNVEKLLCGVKLPRMAKAHLDFDAKYIEDAGEYLRGNLECFAYEKSVLPGQRIAITCGSRGIANSAVIIKTIAEHIKSKGATPFIVPAMGSHGGATAKGQLDMVRSLGVTEEITGCEILSAMEPVELGAAPDGELVYLDKNAYEADGIVLFNRIKAHTSFRGKYESGLMKMMAVGLGKQKGADVFHNMGPEHYLEKLISYAGVVLSKANIVFGVGVVENAFDNTALIEVINPSDIPEREPELLKKAFELMPCLPVGETDVLIVDEIGKEISGNGMDPNITGRFDNPYTTGGINAKRCIVLDLTESTHGNITGLGMADLTTVRVMGKVSYENSLPNVITNNVVELIKVPAVLKNDRMAIQAAIETLTFADKNNVRIIRIKNTAELKEIYISQALDGECGECPFFKRIGEFTEIEFDQNGNLF